MMEGTKTSARAETRMRRSRDKILAAAEMVFLANGFRGSNLDEVARIADVSKQTVYAHFKSKRELFIAVVEAMTGGGFDTHRARVQDPPANSSLGQFLSDYAAQQLAIVMTPRLLQLRRLVIGERALFPEMGEALYRRGPGQSISRLATILKKYEQRGGFIGDAAVAAANFNWLVMGGPTSATMLLGDAAIPSTQAQKRHVAECVRVFLAAYGRPQATST